MRLAAALVACLALAACGEDDEEPAAPAEMKGSDMSPAQRQRASTAVAAR